MEQIQTATPTRAKRGRFADAVHLLGRGTRDIDHGERVEVTRVGGAGHRVIAVEIGHAWSSKSSKVTARKRPLSSFRSASFLLPSSVRVSRRPINYNNANQTPSNGIGTVGPLSGLTSGTNYTVTIQFTINTGTIYSVVSTPCNLTLD